MRRFWAMAVQNLHHAVFRRELSFLKALFFEFLFRGQVEFVPKGFQRMFQILVLLVKDAKFVVMIEELLDEFFLSAFHGYLLPVSMR
jgi:hypothetical protein